MNLLDRPDGERKFHAQPTPLLGGLAVTVPFVLGVFAISVGGGGPPILPLLAVIVFSFVLLGFRDDRHRMDAAARLALGVALVAVLAPMQDGLVLHGLAFSFLSEPLSLGVFGVAFTALVVVGLINAVNMTDGMDGLLPGLWVIWTIAFLIYAPAAWLPVGLLVLASLLVVLAFNCRGRLFLGDAGSYGAGALVGLTAIALYNDPEVHKPADVAVAWLLIPVIDCLRVMLLRVVKGQSPMAPDRNHLHHRLTRRMGRWSAVASYWALVAVPTTMTLLDPTLAPAAIGLAVMGYATALLLTAASAERGAEA